MFPHKSTIRSSYHVEFSLLKVAW